MSLKERPPILRGSTQEQVNTLRDYLFRMVTELDAAIEAGDRQSSAALITNPDGTKSFKPGAGGSSGAAVEEVKKSAAELRSLLAKSANELRRAIVDGDAYVEEYCEGLVAEFDGVYVARSEFGQLEQTMRSSIEASARGVVESYNFDERITAITGTMGNVQNIMTRIDGEIRHGIVQDPDDNNNHVTGIAISQNLKIDAGQGNNGECAPDDPNNPGDGQTYYYITPGQTFGLYTSSGWQFWIDGHKTGWFNSLTGSLHVGSLVVESVLQVGGNWALRSEADEFEILYLED